MHVSCVTCYMFFCRCSYSSGDGKENSPQRDLKMDPHFHASNDVMPTPTGFAFVFFHSAEEKRENTRHG